MFPAAAAGAVSGAAHGAAGGQGVARGGVYNRVPLTDRQHFMNSFEAGEDYLRLANQLGINHCTARNIIWVWLQGGEHNVFITGATDEAIQWTNRVSRTIHDADQYQTAAAAAIS